MLLCSPRGFEICSGSARLCKDMAALGFSVLAWDILYGKEYDLTVKHIQARCKRILGSCHLAHFAPPCQTCSLARRGDAPRSRRYPMGKPDLRDSDKHKVEHANILIVWVASMVAFLGSLNIAGSLENPRGSRLFLLPLYPTSRTQSRCANCLNCVLRIWHYLVLAHNFHVLEMDYSGPNRSSLLG